MKKPCREVCKVHNTALVCPRCIAAKGGKATARKHSHAQLASWGRMGGRPTADKVARKKAAKKG